MAIIKSLRKLTNLDMHVKVQDGIIKLLNQSLNKESNLKHLTITFIDPALATTQLDGSVMYPSAPDGGKQPQKFDITFPRYLKHLKSLKLRGICAPDFTETMFDMASVRRLKSLSIGLINEQHILPNFSEAVSRFCSLERLELHQICYAKINQDIFLEYLVSGAPHLRVLSFSQMNLSDLQLKRLLEIVNKKCFHIRTFKLHGVYLDTDVKLNLIAEFLERTHLARVKLSHNMLNNLDVLTNIGHNKCLKRLTLAQQSYFKTSLMQPQNKGDDPFATGKAFPWEAGSALETKELNSFDALLAAQPGSADERRELRNSAYLKLNEATKAQQQNLMLEQLKLTNGQMFTVKPLVQCFQKFPRLRKLAIKNIMLKSLHFQAIENYL